MKIQILSDLHLEFRGEPENSYDFVSSLLEDVDVLVLAGDVTVSSHMRGHLKQFCELWPQVIYVTGNHEYYHASFNTVHKKLKSLVKEFDNLHWLHGSSVEIDGQKFLGGTMWFPANDQSTDFFYQRRLNDFRLITGIRDHVFKSHNKLVKYLKKNVTENDIVITHHLPHIKSTPERFRQDVTNCFYASNQIEIIGNNKPKLWIHGHTHDSCDYTLDKTRVLCNPYGYVGYEVNPEWKGNLVVEV